MNDASIHTQKPRLSRVFGASLVFIVSYFVALAVARWALFGLPTQLSLATLAGGAFAWFIFVEVQAIRGMDELQRRIQLEALAIAFPLTLLLLMMLGLLEVIGELPKTGFSYRHVWPLVVFFYFVGLAIARRRYV